MNGLDGRQQEVVQDLGAQHPLFHLIHHALRAGVPRGPGSSFCPYSPKCVEDEFSEVGGYKRTPIRAPRLPLAPHTSPARFKGGLVGFVARDRYEQWRLATYQLPENSSEEGHLPSPG